MSATKAYGMEDQQAPVAPLTIERRDVAARDVAIRVDYCGICHSDIHFARNDWGNAMYPAVPGHEIVGTVTEVGDEVTEWKVGQTVAVGCMVQSCKRCGSCDEGEEQFCENGMTMTYGSKDPVLGGPTFGGYTESIVVREDFVLRVPDNLDPAGVAPLLCAGITTYSPLRNWDVGKGQKVGVVGLGGLGHMGVKFAAAMGAHVVMITTSPDKAGDAESLGAHEVLISKDQDDMAKHMNSFDFILNTVPVAHPLDGYMALLKRDGAMVIVGALDQFDGLHTAGLVMGRKSLAGSFIGGIPQTQEMLDFCGEHNIVSDIEMTGVDKLNEAWERVVSGDVKYRFVIDMSTSRDAA